MYGFILTYSTVVVFSDGIYPSFGFSSERTLISASAVATAVRLLRILASVTSSKTEGMIG